MVLAYSLLSEITLCSAFLVCIDFSLVFLHPLPNTNGAIVYEMVMRVYCLLNNKGRE